jgi:alginate O-acetyltransferase complex protein AlgI
MVFSSQIFLFIFLPFALLGYYLIRKDFRNLYLLIISAGFYAWTGKMLLLVLLASITINYFFGIWIGLLQKRNGGFKHWAVIIAVLLNIILLGYFKYFNFLTSTLNNISSLNLPVKEMALILGISFYTFSGISYILDLNAGRIEPQKNPIRFSLYMSFFPKLIQGPISRYKDIDVQITDRVESTDKFATGAYRFVVGLAKKVALADQLGIVVNQIYAAPAINHSIPVAWLGAISYAFQIYFDFSGYTDMAIGLGKMFGFDIVENFNYPYISTSITEFWRRWHITLGSWFRDYVFYPLEFKRRRVKVFRQETNTLIVFFLTGLWHGAAWNFILWGLWHGIFIVMERVFSSIKLKFILPVYIKWLITILALLIGWVLFRSPDLKYAGDYLGIMFGFFRVANPGTTLSWYLSPKTAFILAIAIVASIPWRKLFSDTFMKYKDSLAATICLDISFVVLLIFSIILVISSSYNSFIYFKF